MCDSFVASLTWRTSQTHLVCRSGSVTMGASSHFTHWLAADQNDQTRPAAYIQRYDFHNILLLGSSLRICSLQSIDLRPYISYLQNSGGTCFTPANQVFVRGNPWQQVSIEALVNHPLILIVLHKAQISHPIESWSRIVCVLIAKISRWRSQCFSPQFGSVHQSHSGRVKWSPALACGTLWVIESRSVAWIMHRAAPGTGISGRMWSSITAYDSSMSSSKT